MQTKTLVYRGYKGSIEYSVDDKTYHGKILYINGLVTYEAPTLPALRVAFEDAVDDYVQFCRRHNVKELMSE